MNDPGNIISDEEYLPLPKQLQPIPASKWTDFSPSGISDPALQLTPEKGVKLTHLATNKNDSFPAGRTETYKEYVDKVPTVNPLKTSKAECNNNLDGSKELQISAWVEKHHDNTTVYNTCTTHSEGSFPENVSVKGHKDKKVKKSGGCQDVFRKSNHVKSGMSSKQNIDGEKKLKPILHKTPRQSSGGNEKGTSKKHVRLAESSDLDKPQLHSTAALEAKLRQVEGETFDSRKAIEKNLGESEEARSLFAGRIAGGVNVPKNVNKYSGLASIDVSKQAVLDQAVEERLMKLKIRPEDTRRDSEPPPPDVLDVFTSDMIVEYPDCDISCVTLPSQTLQQVPMEEVFYLYERIQGWEK